MNNNTREKLIYASERILLILSNQLGSRTPKNVKRHGKLIFDACDELRNTLFEVDFPERLSLARRRKLRKRLLLHLAAGVSYERLARRLTVTVARVRTIAMSQFMRLINHNAKWIKLVGYYGYGDAAFHLKPHYKQLRSDWPSLAPLWRASDW